MIIKYNSIIINGRDRSGQIEEVPDNVALHLIKQGYAELAPSIQTQDPVEDKPKKRNRPWA